MIPKTYVWKTASVIHETKDAVTIVFDTNGEYFDYKPGQFLTVSLVINGKAVSRSYSLSSSPGEDERPSITIKRIDNGIMSQYIFHYAEEVKYWTVHGPLGLFYPTEQTLKAEHVILLAGGSGITPLFSILKYLLKQTTCKVSLIYSNKTWETTIFKSVLIYLEKIFPARFTVQFIFTEKGGQAGFPKTNYVTGRLGQLVLKKLIKKMTADSVASAQYFICGPGGLINTAEKTLESLQVEPTHIQKEFFVAEDANRSIVLPDKELEVLFHFYEQTNLLEVSPGKTILEAALEERIPVPYSCKSGNCGVCAARLTSGKVHLSKNFALSEDQLQSGFILLCQSYPMDDQVTVTMMS